MITPTTLSLAYCILLAAIVIVPPREWSRSTVG
jgi:hypothetical protein